MARQARPLRERLYAKLEPCPDADCKCLLWQGHVDPSGYGRITVGGRPHYIHRVAWELDNGPIPDGLHIDHVKARGCRHKHCGLVAHLEPVTTHVNTLRGAATTTSALMAAAAVSSSIVVPELSGRVRFVSPPQAP